MRGQVLSTEIVLSITIFLAAMLVFLFAWNSISDSYDVAQQAREMEVALVGVSDALVLSPGDPADWEITSPENASMMGLAKSQNILSPRKLLALQSLNSSYDIVRERMGAAQFQVFVSASYVGEDGPYASFGVPASEGGSGAISVSIDRLALMEGRLAILKVQLWKTKGA